MYGCTKSEFDIFAKKPVQSAVLGTRVAQYKPIAPVDQSDIEFIIPGDNESYIDMNIHIMVRGKLVKPNGEALDATEHTSVINNLLHSLFSQCSVTLNGVSVTPSKDMYNYRSYLETLLTYGHDAANTHLTNAFFYLDTGDLLGGSPETSSNSGYKKRWAVSKQSKELEMYGKIHSDIFNIPQLLLPGVQLQITFTKSKSDFYLLGSAVDSKAVFKFLDVTLFVKHVKPSPSLLLAHTNALEKVNARYDVTRVVLKTFTFSSGSKSLSIDNAILGTIPKRLLFTMVKNEDFVGKVNTNPYKFQHFGLNSFVMYVNGVQVPSGGLSLNTSHEKSTTLAYQTLFNGSGIHHSNSGLQITHDLFINGYFMLVFDLTPDGSASDGHVSLPENGNIRIELKFDSALTDAITCLLYLEYDGSVQIDKLRNVTTDF